MHHLPLAELEKAVLERQRTRPAGIERQVAYHAILYRTSWFENCVVCGASTTGLVFGTDLEAAEVGRRNRAECMSIAATTPNKTS